jgi:hypothetical protein
MYFWIASICPRVLMVARACGTIGLKASEEPTHDGAHVSAMSVVPCPRDQRSTTSRWGALRPKYAPETDPSVGARCPLPQRMAPTRLCDRCHRLSRPGDARATWSRSQTPHRRSRPIRRLPMSSTLQQGDASLTANQSVTEKACPCSGRHAPPASGSCLRGGARCMRPGLGGGGSSLRGPRS